MTVEPHIHDQAHTHPVAVEIEEARQHAQRAQAAADDTATAMEATLRAIEATATFLRRVLWVTGPMLVIGIILSALAIWLKK